MNDRPLLNPIDRLLSKLLGKEKIQEQYHCQIRKELNYSTLIIRHQQNNDAYTSKKAD